MIVLNNVGRPSLIVVSPSSSSRDRLCVSEEVGLLLLCLDFHATELIFLVVVASAAVPYFLFSNDRTSISNLESLYRDQQLLGNFSDFHWQVGTTEFSCLQLVPK